VAEGRRHAVLVHDLAALDARRRAHQLDPVHALLVQGLPQGVHSAHHHDEGGGAGDDGLVGCRDLEGPAARAVRFHEHEVGEGGQQVHARRRDAFQLVRPDAPAEERGPARRGEGLTQRDQDRRAAVVDQHRSRDLLCERAHVGGGRHQHGEAGSTRFRRHAIDQRRLAAGPDCGYHVPADDAESAEDHEPV